ncbi:hypothetical protein GJJ29_21905 [Enterobacter cloacae subsp. dissolvens]|uniref:hypothetical protein n=1 Tax=Enterobacter cloacae TaxID=550 RepID=UPI00129E2E58|nr:hypothetical protein [Enterobacter cloacae]MRM13847.1 hypothetical protein [Enterobacter cloacae subsp. dissolvens]
MPFIPWRGYLFSYLTSGYRYALPAALCRVQPFKALRATIKTDRVHSRALARHSMAKKIFRRPKSHYTAPACGFWIINIFQFYFSSNRTARPHQCWRLCGKAKLKTMKRISLFFTFIDLLGGMGFPITS